MPATRASGTSRCVSDSIGSFLQTLQASACRLMSRAYSDQPSCGFPGFREESQHQDTRADTRINGVIERQGCYPTKN